MIIWYILYVIKAIINSTYYLSFYPFTSEFFWINSSHYLFLTLVFGKVYSSWFLDKIKIFVFRILKSSTLTIGVRSWPSTLKFDVAPWHFIILRLRSTTNCQVDPRHSFLGLALIIDVRNCHFTLTFNIDILSWRSMLALDVDTWHYVMPY